MHRSFRYTLNRKCSKASRFIEKFQGEIVVPWKKAFCNSISGTVITFFFCSKSHSYIFLGGLLFQILVWKSTFFRIFCIIPDINFLHFTLRYRLLYLHKMSLPWEIRDGACNIIFFIVLLLPELRDADECSIAKFDAFPRCISQSFHIHDRIDIRKGIRDIRSNPPKRYHRALRPISLTVSQHPRIFVSLTGIEKPTLQPGLWPRARMKLWFPAVSDVDGGNVLNCFLLKNSAGSRISETWSPLRLQ